MKIKTVDSIIVVPDSSLIQKLRWDKVSEKSTNGNLTVMFKSNNEVYSYENVPHNIVESLLNSESIGKFFAEEIRNNYSFHKETKWENI